MTNQGDTYEKKVIKCIRIYLIEDRERTDIAKMKITPETRFREDLDITDSLDFVEMTMKFEDECGIDPPLPDALYQSWRTVQDAIDTARNPEAKRGEYAQKI